MRLVRVAVPVPALDSLTYSLPDGVPVPENGARVIVPLGSRVMTGCVVGLAPDDDPTTDRSRIKSVVEVLDQQAFLPDDVLRLATWVAEYYACGIGEALATAMPPLAATGATANGDRPNAFKTIRIAQLTAQGLDHDHGQRESHGQHGQHGRPGGHGQHGQHGQAGGHGQHGVHGRQGGHVQHGQHGQQGGHGQHGVHGRQGGNGQGPQRLGLGAKQQEALALLRGAPDGLSTSELAARGITAPTVKRLAALGLVSILRRQVDRDPFAGAHSVSGVTRAPVVLTPEQDDALVKLRGLTDAGGFQAALLHGVTGSGKTELYLRLAAEALGRGRTVMVLVPEIALTPVVADTFRATFGQRVAIQHSGLSDGERHDQWHRIRRGDVSVVVGTRSAVFTPLASLGLVIVDEEHDGSYKQEESPRYNGRDVAVMRARQADALIVLGSATPSLESYQNALTGRYTLVTLTRRVLDRPLAEVQIVDMREVYASEGPDVVLSGPLCDAMTARLERGEQAMVLLNRRGFASSVLCRQCGATFECPNCSVSLTVHRAAHRARCHYCNYSISVPTACANCRAPYIELIGFGTERVEAEVKARFPDARVARVDRDTIRRRGAIAALLAKFSAREIDVLVGTQMIAKGHDFPRVTLVGVISADVGLGFADFRAGERTFQLLTQVAGRAGRGEIRGQAVVQTLFPDHYSIQHACRQDYAGFFAQEIRFRQEMRYPPAVALVNAVVKGRTHQAAMRDAGLLVQALRSETASYRVLGPAPAPLSRLKGEHRAQFFLKGSQRAPMRKALLAALAAHPELRRRVIVDVDPMSVL